MKELREGTASEGEGEGTASARSPIAFAFWSEKSTNSLHVLQLHCAALGLHSIHIWVTSPSVQTFFMDSQSLSQSPK